tara:strand:+ start:172 stop:465 length:294 start_codon:yes stop_codon:yes gene_type:complete
MKNQFFYTRTVTTPESEEIKEYRESFNIDKVIRSVSLDDGRTLILLDDIHERSTEVPDINIKTNKMNGYKRERNTYQSEVFLDAPDAFRFFNLTAIQ